MRFAETIAKENDRGEPERVPGEAAWRLVESSPELATPAYLFDLDQIDCVTRRVQAQCRRAEVRLLYSIKALPLAPAVRAIASHVDGLAASSYFESKLAREILDEAGDRPDRVLHLTTPGLRPDQVDAVAQLCDAVTLNSLSQWQRFVPQGAGRVEVGLRINPQMSVLSDVRYDPCRPHSKLGVPLDQLTRSVQHDLTRDGQLAGLHFHTNYDARSLTPLFQTVERVLDTCPTLLDHVRWINLGGGYRLDLIDDVEPLARAADALRSAHDVEVLIEPGAALVRGSGTLVTTVIDRFESEGRTVAVLDTSVNHLPQVFEYQMRPTLHGESHHGRHRVILAGCTCLAGDLFGEYALSSVPEIGTKLLFSDVGAYAMSKSHWLNGVNLPTVYTHHGADQLTRVIETTYDDFSNRCGIGPRNAHREGEAPPEP